MLRNEVKMEYVKSVKVFASSPGKKKAISSGPREVWGYIPNLQVLNDCSSTKVGSKSVLSFLGIFTIERFLERSSMKQIVLV